MKESCKSHHWLALTLPTGLQEQTCAGTRRMSTFYWACHKKVEEEANAIDKLPISVMKRIFVMSLIFASSASFAQMQENEVYSQSTNEKIQAIREQLRSIGQANIDRQRAAFLPELLTPKADPKLEIQRLEVLRAINALRYVSGQPPLQ